MTVLPGPELIPLEEAVRRLGLPRRTFARRIADGSVDLYRDGRDRRRKLIHVGDVDRLARPVLVQRQSA
jgi:hypothetical protein